ncbi:hypothetical protein PLICRDRAFT_107434 [Plicaturopsis crispa FD-325 SS-3]|nr:hypothetical protein PLICRDRAFT_107434 [Plicaturopsis crispa FD-325 SS-3]
MLSTPLDTQDTQRIQLTDQTNLLPFRKIIAVFVGLALCVIVTTLDSVIVATALPTISSAFNAGAVSLWVPSAYMVTSTAFQPLYGRFSDIFGRKAALCLAMTLYMIGSLAAGFSRSIIQVIVFRGVAGAGGGGIVNLSQIVASDVVSLRDRGKYQGIIAGFNALGYAVGPLIGGVLSQKVSWRWCFWITLPVSLCGIAAVIFVLPLKSVEGDMRRKLMAVDYFGAGLTLVGCTLVLLPLIWGGVTFPWRSAIVLAPLCSGMVVASIFCIWEWKGAQLPIVPMYIFKHKTVIGVYITMFINGFIFFSTLFYLPQFFQVALGYSPIRSGIFLLPVLVSQTVASGSAGALVSHTGRYRTIIHVGFSVWAIGSGCLSTINASSPKPLLVLYMLLAGMGSGQTTPTTTVAAQASVARKDMSVVTAVRNFIRLLGGTLSLGVGSTIVNNSLRSSMTALALPPATITRIIDDPSLLSPMSLLSPVSLAPTDAADILAHGYAHGIRTVFVLNAALAVIAVGASLALIRHQELVRGDEEALRKEAVRGEDIEMGDRVGTQEKEATPGV